MLPDALDYDQRSTTYVSRGETDVDHQVRRYLIFKKPILLKKMVVLAVNSQGKRPLGNLDATGRITLKLAMK